MDPEVVATEDGPVMLMGNFEGIHAVPMNAAGDALDGDPVRIAGTGVEAPTVVRHDGYTHLFTSAGLCCTGETSQYRVLAGRAESLMGPYVTRTGSSLAGHLAGDVILEGDDDWVGPGHVDVATDDAGQDWMIYHAAPRGSAVLPNGVQRRYMMLDRLTWESVPGADGTWPVVDGGTPNTVRPADPVVTLPVRLTAVGEVTRRDDDDNTVDTLDLAVRLHSTGAPYAGELTATITGPDKQRLPLSFVTGDVLAAGPPLAPALAVGVAADGVVDLSLALRSAAPLAPGRYELVVAISRADGAAGTNAAGADEIAVFGLEIADDGSIEFGSGPLGSLGLGSSGS